MLRLLGPWSTVGYRRWIKWLHISFDIFTNSWSYGTTIVLVFLFFMIELCPFFCFLFLLIELCPFFHIFFLMFLLISSTSYVPFSVFFFFLLISNTNLNYRLCLMTMATWSGMKNLTPWHALLLHLYCPGTRKTEITIDISIIDMNFCYWLSWFSINEARKSLQHWPQMWTC